MASSMPSSGNPIYEFSAGTVVQKRRSISNEHNDEIVFRAHEYNDEDEFPVVFLVLQDIRAVDIRNVSEAGATQAAATLFYPHPRYSRGLIAGCSAKKANRKYLLR